MKTVEVSTGMPSVAEVTHSESPVAAVRVGHHRVPSLEDGLVAAIRLRQFAKTPESMAIESILEKMSPEARDLVNDPLSLDSLDTKLRLALLEVALDKEELRKELTELKDNVRAYLKALKSEKTAIQRFTEAGNSAAHPPEPRRFTREQAIEELHRMLPHRHLFPLPTMEAEDCIDGVLRAKQAVQGVTKQLASK